MVLSSFDMHLYVSVLLCCVSLTKYYEHKVQ